MPTFVGNGLAMRGAMVLRALATRYAVTLRVHRLYASPAVDVPDDVAVHCEAVSVDPPAARRPGWLPWPRRPRFALVHAFRLATLPLLEPYLAERERPFVQLDLDDVESVARRRVADLYEAAGEHARAEEERRAAAAARAAEDAALDRLDRVLVCSRVDRDRLVERGPRAALAVLPNAVAIPDEVAPRPAEDPFRLLFVGTLGYYPNVDALTFFAGTVLPRVRAAAPRPVELVVAGLGAGPPVQALGALPGVRLIGAVADVTPWYAAAHAVVAPIRAGGGTRIKILEAFAHRRPVVSTTLGAEGIEAVAERELLVGDTAEELAGQCLRLVGDGALGDALAERALALVRRRYSPEAMASAVADDPAPPPRRAPR